MSELVSEQPRTLQRISAAQIARMLGKPAPTEEQSAVIESPLGPSAIVAGAGSGKTETMAGRVVWLVINRLVDPDKVLGLTFTRKAAGELAERIRDRLAAASRALVDVDEEHRVAMLHAEPTVLTYDSYARRIVSEHGLRAGIEPGVTTADQSALWLIADRVVGESSQDIDEIGLARPSVVNHVVDLSDELAAHLRSVDDLEAELRRVRAHLESVEAGSGKAISATAWKSLGGITTAEELVPVLRDFERAKAERDLMSFGDTMREAHRLVSRFGDIARVERERYDVVLLDEYQDTSAAQADFLRALFRGHPITAVGDPCQAIYGFRGASADTLPAYRREFGDGELVEVSRLQTSFRNDRVILDLANVVSEPLREGGAEVAQLAPGPLADDGTLEVSWCETIEDECAAVVADIAALHAEGRTSSETTAVLCRARSYEYRNIIEGLRESGVPVEVVGLGGLLTTPEIVDLTNMLRVLSDPEASVALVQLLSSARWKIGPRDLMALRRHARGLRHTGRRGGESATDDPIDPDEVDETNIIDALDEIERAPRAWFSQEGHRRLVAFAGELRALRDAMGESLADLVSLVERRMSLDIETTVRDLRRGLAPRATLDQFIAIASEFSSGSGSDSLSAFLAYVDTAIEVDRGLVVEGVEPREGAVQVLTAHSAKGLEWDRVYVPGLAVDRFPAQVRPSAGWLGGRSQIPYELRGDFGVLPKNPLFEVEAASKVGAAVTAFKEPVHERHLLEERRLFYVAATRARHFLWLSGAKWTEGKKARQPAAFLLEARELLEASGGAVRVWAEAPTEDETNPLSDEPLTRMWPVAVPESAREAIAAAQEAVREQPGSVDSAIEGHRWSEATELLIAERQRRQRSGVLDVRLPERLSASQLVALAGDPAQLALDLRRPVPRGLARAADRGTLFHSWVEHRFGTDSLIDIDELPGSADEDLSLQIDIDDLIRAFERSEWASRMPLETETGFDFVIDGVPLRGRLDAVFAWEGEDADFDVIDWKTGRKPSGDALVAAEVQLAVYRIAWSRLKGVPIDRVRAGFHYVADNYTHRPARLLDESEIISLITDLPADD